MSLKVAAESDARRVRETPLSHLQTWFLEAITAEAITDAACAAETAVAPAGDPGEHRPSIDRLVLPSRFLSATDRVRIYHEAYRSRLIECLRDDYPAVEHAVGSESFSALALAYIAAHPSRSPNLNQFGRHFSAFCRHQGEALAFAAELAALEWALVEVLHAGSAPTLAAEALAAVPAAHWVSARFVASPTLRVVSSAFPVNAYYQAWRGDEAPAPPPAQPSATAVFRDAATLWRMELSPPMETLIRALVEGSTLGSALEALEASDNGEQIDGGQVMTWFRDWLRHGFFSAITLDAPV